MKKVVVAKILSLLKKLVWNSIKLVTVQTLRHQVAKEENLEINQ